MRAGGSNSWTVLWMGAPKVIQSKVTPAPRSLLGALTVTLRALEYQSGQAVAWMRCSQIFPGGAAITMSLWAKRSACSGTMPCGQWMCAERRWMSSMIDMIEPSIRLCDERVVRLGFGGYLLTPSERCTSPPGSAAFARWHARGHLTA